jgi:hypothetical protein
MDGYFNKIIKLVFHSELYKQKEIAMSKFNEMSYKGKCDVCEKETDVVVCASSMGAISYSYCQDCLNKHLEPYGGMVAYLSCAGRYPEDINPSYVEYIRRVLKELGKTEDEFISDISKVNEEMEQWYKDMEEVTDDECGE